jgi:hypothetical protein
MNPQQAIKQISRLLEWSAGSPLKFRLLNVLLKRLIPFNVPHRLKVLQLSADSVEVALPFCRANRNHIGGIHACAMATAAEFSSGLLLLKHFDLSCHRLIMMEMTVRYSKQGRSDLIARCCLPAGDPVEKWQAVLKEQGSVEVELSPFVLGSSGETIAQASIRWHIKPWEQIAS